jgi:hypothetical protein
MRCALFFCALSGCATIVDGGRTTVRLDTNPEFAKAIVDGAVHPGDGEIPLDRGRDHRILLRKPGYADREVSIRSRTNGWFWGNFAFGPLFFVGMIVDAASGAKDRLDTDAIAVELEETPGHAGEIARRGIAISDAIERERISLGDLAPLERAETDSWVVAVEGEGDVVELIRLSLAARSIKVTGDRASIAELKLQSYEDDKREETQIPLGAALPATHLLRASVRIFGATCVTSAELYDLETEVATHAVLERSGCSGEDLLYAVDRLTARLIRAPMTTGPVAARRGVGPSESH